MAVVSTWIGEYGFAVLYWHHGYFSSGISCLKSYSCGVNTQWICQHLRGISPKTSVSLSSNLLLLRCLGKWLVFFFRLFLISLFWPWRDGTEIYDSQFTEAHESQFITFLLSHFVGCLSSLRAIVFVETMGIERLTKTFGFGGLMLGIGIIIGAWTLGIPIKSTGSYFTTFALSGSFLVMAGILHLFLREIRRWDEKKSEIKVWKFPKKTFSFGADHKRCHTSKRVAGYKVTFRKIMAEFWRIMGETM